MGKKLKVGKRPVPQKQELKLFLRAAGVAKSSKLIRKAPNVFAVADSKDQKFGKTEVIQSLNPTWKESILLQFELGTPCHVKIEIFSEKSKGNTSLGSVSCDVGDILGSKGNTKKLEFGNGGMVVARVVKAPDRDSKMLNITLQGVQLKNLAKMGGVSDPYVEFFRRDGPKDGPWVSVKCSKHIDNSLDPLWDPMLIDMYDLCRGECNQPILMKVMDYVKKGKHIFMGSFETTVNELIDAKIGTPNMKSFSVINKGKGHGKVLVASASIEGGPDTVKEPPQSVQRLELTIQGIQLKNVERGGKSDPFYELSRKAGDDWLKVHQSPHIDNTLNPMWDPVIFDVARLCDGDYDKPILISVYDWESSGKHKAMGTVETTTDELIEAKLGAPGMKTFPVVLNGKEHGKLMVTDAVVTDEAAKVVVEPKKIFEVTFQGLNLKNVERMGKSDPFLEISRSDAKGRSWIKIFRSPHKDNTLNPVWDPMSIGYDKLCSGDDDKAILIAAFDHEKNGKHVSMGSFETTVSALIESVAKKSDGNNSFTLNKKGKDFGKIFVSSASIVEEKTDAAAASKGSAAIDGLPPSTDDFVPEEELPRKDFIDYISGGCEMNMCIAIDFSESNGNPQQKGTYHYQSDKDNNYEHAIKSVVNLISKYDSDQMYPVWGFGARFAGKMQNCFQLGDDEVHGVEGVLESYHEVFKWGIKMSKPAVLTEALENAAVYATNALEDSQESDGQCYSVLLILTDGQLDHIEETKIAMINASEAPLSIVIVGIGTGDFTNCDALDDFAKADRQVRDICQFVEYRKHKHDTDALTRAIFSEIPEQLVDYFYSNRIMPMPASDENDFEFDADDFKGDGNNDGNGKLRLDFARGRELSTRNVQQLEQVSFTQWILQAYCKNCA